MFVWSQNKNIRSKSQVKWKSKGLNLLDGNIQLFSVQNTLLYTIALF